MWYAVIQSKTIPTSERITMKRTFLIILMVLLCLGGCASQTEYAQIAATTLPVYEFTTRLCEHTD